MWKISEKVLLDVKLRFWRSRRVVTTVKTGYYLPYSCENCKWPLVCSTSIFSASTWPNFKSKVSFEILRTSRLQNWPYFLNLVKIWWIKRPKTNLCHFIWPIVYEVDCFWEAVLLLHISKCMKNFRTSFV